jgi:hypothetical protein
MVLDVPNTVWTLASAELSAFVDGPREWIVFMGMRGQASLRSFSDIFHLRLSPARCCELGRAWTLHRGALHLDQPFAFTSAFAHDCLQVCVFAMPVCKGNAHEMCLWRRVRACVRELKGLTPDERPELGHFVSREYLSKLTNASGVKSSFMACLCYSTHASITRHLLNSPSSFKTVPRGSTRLPG